MLTNDQLSAVGKVLTAYSWLQGNIILAFSLLLEGDAEAKAVILNNLTLADRVGVTVQLLEQHANRKKVSASAFQEFDAALRRAFDLLKVPLSLPELAFDANVYAEHRNDVWSGFTLNVAKGELEQMASAYLDVAAGLLGATCAYGLELEGGDGRNSTDADLPVSFSKPILQ